MNDLLEKKKDVKIFSAIAVSVIIGSMLMIAGPLTTTKLAYAQQAADPGSVLKLAAANIPIDIPLIRLCEWKRGVCNSN